MRKLLTWIVVTVGIGALVRRLRRRGAESEPSPAEQAAEDPADELRRKLAEARAEDKPKEPEEPPAAAPETAVEERRADVHDQGRATLDEMKSSDES